MESQPILLHRPEDLERLGGQPAYQKFNLSGLKKNKNIFKYRRQPKKNGNDIEGGWTDGAKPSHMRFDNIRWPIL